MWIVIWFTDENLVEVAPLLWFNAEQQTCKWPPSAMKAMEIQHFIKKNKSALESWGSFPAKILGTYGKV